MYGAETGRYRFIVKEGRAGEGGGDHPPVTVALEPAGEQIGVLREGHLSLRLAPGFTVEQARELARRLNDVVTSVAFVKY
ncbi:MAG: hypothetical protein IT496_07910 [Gammaproteobacteria bacterium]|nr:hypothetical protein [Gammaproteobacteria bacterium]MCG3145156.1 hypothetical protein [Gammaproteobacteria bacterium]